MSYTPKSEEQLAKEGLLPDGIYDYEVIQTDDKPSKKGNDMYTLKLLVWDDNGDNKTVYDYIALGNNFGERKLRHAADASGLLSIYEGGNLKPADFMNTKGRVEIKMQDGTADYPLPKNVVKDYVKRPQKETAATGAIVDEVKKVFPGATSVADDEIPF